MTEWSTEFSGTLLEQVNAAISEVFWRSTQGFPFAELTILCRDHAASRLLQPFPTKQNGSITRRARFSDTPWSLSRPFRGVPRLLSELRFVRRRWRPRRTLAPVLVSLGHLGSLFGGQHVRDLRHHFRVRDFHFHLNLRPRLSF